jgi:hypothetical protein
MKTYGEWRYSATRFYPRHYIGWVISFIPEDAAHGSYWKVGWMGSRFGLDIVEKK